MKVGLRILVILVSLGILATAFWPPSGPEEKPSPDAAKPEATEEPRDAGDGEEGGAVVRDLFGGVALDAGKKAKSVISEVDETRKESFEELDEAN